MQHLLPLLILLFTYLALSGSAQFSNIVLGTLIVTGIFLLLRPRRQPVNWTRIPSAFIALASYVGIVIYNTVVSGLQVARIVRETLQNLGVDFPKIDDAARLALVECRKSLERS